ncbi:ABC transporter permease [Planomonospora parontospora]|uniref:ABC transporter permease n=1 Tax=Planomonospora parontospora TaxID=58119 RepID=UPI0016708A7D|nr:ABC transporter permease [Planomonospora parontospora]GGL51462.1 transport permease protein [Planomonospora parontospora subsp. antibiotica]GII19110.1 transport permease protein [Planomonospora parontospora subsp. antibiotica]
MNTITETGLLAGRTLRRFARSPQLVADSLLFPLILLFLMLLVFGELVDQAVHGRYIDRLAPAIVLFSAAYGAVGTGLGFFTDLRGGIVDRFRAMDIGRISILAGRITGDLVRAVLVAAATTAVAHLAGFRFTQGPQAVLGFFGVVALFAWIFLWPAVAVATSASSEQAVGGALNTPVTLLLFLSSGFVPVEQFPGWLQPVVRANPLSLACDALTGLSGGGPVLLPVLFTAAWAVGATAVFLPLAVRRLK